MTTTDSPDPFLRTAREAAERYAESLRDSYWLPVWGLWDHGRFEHDRDVYLAGALAERTRTLGEVRRRLEAIDAHHALEIVAALKASSGEEKP